MTFYKFKGKKYIHLTFMKKKKGTNTAAYCYLFTFFIIFNSNLSVEAHQELQGKNYQDKKIDSIKINK